VKKDLDEAEAEFPALGSALANRAIGTCDMQMQAHRRSARWTLLVLLFLLSGVAGIALLVVRVVPEMQFAEVAMRARTAEVAGIVEVARASIDNRFNKVTYGLFAFAFVVFGVLMAVYRFHLGEIAKAEHYKLGFLRIALAGGQAEFASSIELQLALIRGAFDNQHDKHPKRSVESPLPGHITTDIATSLLNKIIGSFDIVAKPRSGDDKKGE
jgi:hypothetical protein